MGFSYQPSFPPASPPQLPIEFVDSTTTETPAIPPSAIGFTYVLCGGGGGGGNGGVSIGGGGGGAGEFIEGTIMLSDLAEAIGCTIPQIQLVIIVGPAGEAGDMGGDSNLYGTDVERWSCISIASGGARGLAGTDSIGHGYGEWGTTYADWGGTGELAIQNEARSTRNQSIDRPRESGNGGDGGNAGQPGSPGLAGYCSITFF